MFLNCFISYIPSSPGRLVEDIAEIMKKEQSDDTTMDSMYETDTSVNPNASGAANHTKHVATKNMLDATILDNRPSSSFRPQPKKAKKSLESSWDNTELPYLIETPVSFV